MKKLLTILVCGSLIAMFSCTKPSGVEVTEYFDVPSYYDQLYVSDGMEIIVTDKVDEIVITADENVMNTVKVECSGGKLRIYRKDFSVFRLMKGKVQLPYNENLREVEATMYATFETPYSFEFEDRTVKLEASSYADISVKYIFAKNLTIKASNDSDIHADVDINNLVDLTLDNSDAELTGSTENLKLTMNDKSELIRHWGNGGYNFDCAYCYGSMYGKCKAYLHCYDDLAVKLSNESILYYTGDPDYDESEWDDTSALVCDNK